MPEMTLVKTGQGELAGFGQESVTAWARFKSWWRGLDAGEFFMLEYRTPRNAKFHRKFFALLNVGFEHWEPTASRKHFTHKGQVIAKNFERFRKDITILAGYGEPIFDLKGRMHLEAKSISFAKMSDDEFSQLYEAVLKVLLEQVLTNYAREDIDRVVAELQGFGS